MYGTQEESKGLDVLAKKHIILWLGSETSLASGVRLQAAPHQEPAHRWFQTCNKT
jgi:hypothetical protein